MTTNPPSYNPSTHYLRKQYYRTKAGETKISYSLIKRKAKSTKRGPAFKEDVSLTQADYDKISNLRQYNAPWKNIASDYSTTAYHIKKLYESYAST